MRARHLKAPFCARRSTHHGDIASEQAPAAPEDRQVLARWRVTDSIRSGGLCVRAAPSKTAAVLLDEGRGAVIPPRPTPACRSLAGFKYGISK
jgi:hypothetical protein